MACSISIYTSSVLHVWHTHDITWLNESIEWMESDMVMLPAVLFSYEPVSHERKLNHLNTNLCLNYFIIVDL